MRDALKPWTRRLTFGAAEAFWATTFALVGRMVRPRPARLTFNGSDRVLVVAPHPDDETLGCGGTLALHARAGDQVLVVVATDGSGSRAGGIGSREMAQKRSEEAAAAASALNVDLESLSLPEGRWEPRQLEEALTGLLMRFSPTLIYAPSCVDFHPEHRRVASALAQVLDGEYKGNCNSVRVYEVQVPLTWVLANRVCHIRRSIAAKRNAIAAYQTQADTLASWERHARYLLNVYGDRGSVEVFWELAPTQYTRLAQTCASEHLRFRGIRPRPFTDGFAWLVGLRARAALKHQV